MSKVTSKLQVTRTFCARAYNGLSELVSEDFQHDRLYGTVRVVNPFL